jgi:DNA polymerase (family 10)
MALSNQEIAQKLRRHASELARAGSNLYRVRAFRSAAMAVMGLPREVSDLVAKGDARLLERVPGIGPSLADTIARYSLTPDDRVAAEESARRSANLSAA